MTTPHLFRISKAAWDAATPEEVKATCDALREAGLYALPYDSVDVEIQADCCINWIHRDEGEKRPRGLVSKVYPDGSTRWISNFGPSVVARFTGLTTTVGKTIAETIIDYRTKHVHPCHEKTDLEQFERDRWVICDLLITLLATRNAVKETKQNKLAKLGIGKKNPAARYEYITTISPPVEHEMADNPEHPRAGITRTVCPHLRRAHWRDQHFGPGRQFVKRILIPSVFVNADKEWTKTRVAYNVSL